MGITIFPKRPKLRNSSPDDLRALPGPYPIMPNACIIINQAENLVTRKTDAKYAEGFESADDVSTANASRLDVRVST